MLLILDLLHPLNDHLLLFLILNVLLNPAQLGHIIVEVQTLFGA